MTREPGDLMADRAARYEDATAGCPWDDPYLPYDWQAEGDLEASAVREFAAGGFAGGIVTLCLFGVMWMVGVGT